MRDLATGSDLEICETWPVPCSERKELARFAHKMIVHGAYFESPGLQQFDDGNGSQKLSAISNYQRLIISAKLRKM